MSRFKEWEAPEIKEGEDTKYGWRVAYVDNFHMGLCTDIGYGTYIMAKYWVIIGHDVQIGGGVKIYSESTIDDTHGSVIINKGAKIGAMSVIMPGVTIGEGAIIGACSLVKEDVPAGETWFGVPAKPKGGRYVGRQENYSRWGLWPFGSGDCFSASGFRIGREKP